MDMFKLRRHGPMITLILLASFCLAAGKPDMSTEKLATVLSAIEGSIGTLRATGTRSVIPSCKGRKPPGRKAFEEASRSVQLQWGFEGSPDEGKVCFASEGVHPSIGTPHTTTYVAKKSAFDGRFARELWGAQKHYEDGTPSTTSDGPDLAYNGMISGARPSSKEWKILPTHIQAQTLWLSGEPLSRLLTRGEATYEGAETVDGHLTYKVELPRLRGEGKRIVYLDPSRGYCILKQRMTDYAGKTIREWRTNEVHEVAPGISMPKEVVITDLVGKGAVARVVIESCVINEPFEDDYFAIKFPQGTALEDKRKGISYTVGFSEHEMDQLASKAVDDVQANSRVDEEPPNSTDQSASVDEKEAVANGTAEGSSRTKSLVLLVVVGAVCLLCALMFVARRKKR